MRKLFSIFAAMLVALAVSAADQYPDPTESNSLSKAINAVGDNEVIYLDEGTYFNAKGVDYTQPRSGKHYTIKAIDGKKPVVKLEVPFRIREAASAKFIGIKFDGSSINGYDWYFKAYDNTNNVLEFEDCEFTATAYYIIHIPSTGKLSSLVLKNCNFHDNTNRGILNQGTIENLQIKDTKFEKFTNASYGPIENYEAGTIGNFEADGCEFIDTRRIAIYSSGASHIDKFVVNNCYFHDSQRSAIFFEAPSTAKAICDSVFIMNSTFAKFTNTNDYWASIIDIRNGGSQTKLGYVLVDHCTFYDCKTINTDHVAVRIHKSTDATVSNCIFADPNQSSEVADSKRAATNLYGGDVKNCIAYNYLYGTEGHIHNGATYTACSQADPKFVDAANADYTLTRGSVALSAAEDGGAIGDPRWVPAAKKVYCKMTHGWWADAGAIGIYAFGDGGDKNADWPGVRMTKEEGQLGVWSYELDAKYGKVIFTRVNPSNEGDFFWGAKTEDLIVPADDKDLFTISTASECWDPNTVAGEWSVFVPEVPAKFYIVGNEALVGSELDWHADAIKVTEDSYAFKDLEANVYYQLKITTDGSWGTAKGFSDLTDDPVPAGLSADGDDNICFKLAEAGDVTVTYTGTVYKVEGNFWVPRLNNGFYLVGTFDGVDKWEAASLTAEDEFAWNAHIGEGNEEWKISVTLTVGDKFKAVYVYEDNITTWYPEGSGNDYVVDDNHAGASKTIYFQEKYNDEWGGHFYIEQNWATSIDNTNADANVMKRIENGQLIIIKNGVRYNAQGAVVE